LARSAVRQREIAVRLAIGARPARIVRQLLTESVLLAFLGGAFGLLLANWGAAALVRMANRTISVPLNLELDWRVLGFSSAVCLLTGVLFGLAPALRLLHTKLATALKEGARDTSGRGRVAGRALVGAQIALGVLVLMTAGLLVRSLRNLEELDLGYSREQLLLVRVDGLASGYKGAALTNLDRELLDRLRTVPGVRS